MVSVDSSGRMVLAALLDSVPMTRPELASRTSLSRPTISEVVRRLVEIGLIVDAGVRRGRPGRVPTYYRLAPTAGYVVAVDVGGDNLRVAAADMSGTVCFEQRQATRGVGAGRVAAQVARMIASATNAVGEQLGPLRRVGVSAPGAVHADGRTMSAARNLGEDGPFDLITPLEARVDAPIVLENNVNLAALGERWRGHARDVATFAFLAVGAGIGMGLVHNGELVRGAHGAAGEVAYLPLPGSVPPGQRAGRGKAQLADEAGAYGVLAALDARRSWPGTRPSSVEELFAQAAAGAPAARDLVEAEARQLGLTIASACAIFDPELVVLGGGVGRNPLLLPTVRDTVNAYAPFPPRIETSALGEAASLTGALFVALQAARAELLRAVSGPDGG
ncbi:ROK family transcriptional regulator [Micromonospora sp. 4G57]|uniref:ROK family transcriptional regulator n=1 Tax=Micromonospora sicca TaxID=2202420 RepID=A0ABU5JBM0_9ACTN|nr:MULTISPECIES: ROK family transcriptional regulator [unclassified Micromonospora]MDZ5441588.1 ROK family transcriptional regulator [Micromonospora sp. 4G57]MDZ5489985.1 ROK family transcriptional regulator [Micromonospora sp. 4G53]